LSPNYDDIAFERGTITGNRAAGGKRLAEYGPIRHGGTNRFA
jgi:hypothetical protein